MTARPFLLSGPILTRRRFRQGAAAVGALSLVPWPLRRALAAPAGLHPSACRSFHGRQDAPRPDHHALRFCRDQPRCRRYHLGRCDQASAAFTALTQRRRLLIIERTGRSDIAGARDGVAKLLRHQVACRAQDVPSRVKVRRLGLPPRTSPWLSAHGRMGL
jgi:hypothetical protein